MYKDSRRLTLSQIRSWGEDNIQIGYAYLQNLFYYTDRIGYHAGVYGWNFDAYEIGGNKIIMTGYRSMFGRKPKVNIRPYEDRAREIMNDWGLSTDAKCHLLDKLIADLAEKI